MWGDLLYEKFNNEIDLYRFLNRINTDRFVRVVSIIRLSGLEEGHFELWYKLGDRDSRGSTLRDFFESNECRSSLSFTRVQEY